MQRLRKEGEIIELAKNHFDNFIRFIFLSSQETIVQISDTAKAKLARLGLSVDEDDAIMKMPKGSDQVDIGSMYVWFEKIEAGDTVAVRQLKIVAATAQAQRGD